jgi:hypothetical protein
LRLRGPNGAKDEFLLGAPAQNFIEIAKIIPMATQMAPTLASLPLLTECAQKSPAHSVAVGKTRMPCLNRKVNF